MPVTGTPSAARMRSPVRTPPRTAGEPAKTRITVAVSRTSAICIPSPAYELRSVSREKAASCSGEKSSA
jgi:hypothetical protein